MLRRAGSCTGAQRRDCVVTSVEFLQVASPLTSLQDEQDVLFVNIAAHNIRRDCWDNASISHWGRFSGTSWARRSRSISMPSRRFSASSCLRAPATIPTGGPTTAATEFTFESLVASRLEQGRPAVRGTHGVVLAPADRRGIVGSTTHRQPHRRAGGPARGGRHNAPGGGRTAGPQRGRIEVAARRARAEFVSADLASAEAHRHRLGAPHAFSHVRGRRPCDRALPCSF